MDEITQYLNNELKEEIGYDEEGNLKAVTKEELNMLRQKYGLMAPQITVSEKYLIEKEARKNGHVRTGNR